MVNILVFDSGIGGEAVAKELQRLLSDSSVTSINDSKHMPYGNRSADEIFELTHAALLPYINDGFKIIVIACNTATTNAITKLRLSYPDVNFIGIEPMLKPASTISKTKVIAVCATPSTLKSARYNELKSQLSGIEIIEPDCSNWAELIENGKQDLIDIDKTIQPWLEKNVDVIVLGCTHYHWLKDRIVNAVPKSVTVLEPSDAIARRIIDISNA